MSDGILTPVAGDPPAASGQSQSGNGTTRLVLVVTIIVSLLLSALLALTTVADDGRQATASEPRQGLASESPESPAVNVGVESTALMAYLLKMARDSSLDVVSIEVLGSDVARIAAASLAVSRYGLQLRGRLPHIVAFLTRMEQVRVTADTRPSGGSVYLEALIANPEDDEQWLVSAQLLAPAVTN